VLLQQFSHVAAAGSLEFRQGQLNYLLASFLANGMLRSAAPVLVHQVSQSFIFDSLLDSFNLALRKAQ
jgi:hypothetical protein